MAGSRPCFGVGGFFGVIGGGAQVQSFAFRLAPPEKTATLAALAAAGVQMGLVSITSTHAPFSLAPLEMMTVQFVRSGEASNSGADGGL